MKNREVASVTPESWYRSHMEGSGWAELRDRHSVRPGTGISGAEKKWSHIARGEDDDDNHGSSAVFAHTFLIHIPEHLYIYFTYSW